MLFVNIRNIFVFRPPQRPLSVVTNITPTFLTSLSTKNVGRYSGFAFVILAATFLIFSEKGLDARMRSCARRIFDAATISIALVILRVFCTLLILFRISFVPATRLSLATFY